MTAPVVRPSPEQERIDLHRRAKALEQQVGIWWYALPVAPAVAPDAFQPGQAFQNSWANRTGGQPFSYRVHPATKVQIRGDIEGGSVPSVVVTMEPQFRPRKPTTIQWQSQDGTLTWQGRVDPSGDVWILSECPCGAAPPEIGGEEFEGNSTTIADGASTFMSWDNPSGDTLFDLSNPQFPAALAAGIYAVAGAVSLSTTPTLAGQYTAQLDVGSAGFGPVASAPSTVGLGRPGLALPSITWELGIGDTLSLQVSNYDGGAAANDFAFEAAVQKIS